MRFKIENTNAAPIGRSPFSGRKKERLINKTDERIEIACKKVAGEHAPAPKFFGNRRYVRLLLDPRLGWVDLNLNSLRKRLEISKKDIKSHRKDGTLNEFILDALKPKRPRSESVLPETLEGRLKKRFGAADNHQEYDPEKLKKYGISEIQIAEAMRMESGFCTSGEVGHQKQFYVDRSSPDPKKHRLYLVHTHLKTGAVTSVAKFVRLDKASKSKKVIKQLHGDEQDNLNRTAFKMDRETISHVHELLKDAPHKDSQGRPIGIQPNMKSIEEHAVIAKRGKGDLLKFLNVELKTKQILALDILMGCANLQSIRFVHKDIKPDNILCRRNERGELHAELIDFGGSHAASSNPKVRIYTPAYRSTTAWEKLSDPQKFYQYDLFSTGLSLFFLFIGEENLKSIFKIQADQAPDESTFNEKMARKQMRESKVPKAMQEIIIKMIKIEDGYDFNQAVADWQRSMRVK